VIIGYETAGEVQKRELSEFVVFGLFDDFR
jgi:hypothetical protein